SQHQSYVATRDIESHSKGKAQALDQSLGTWLHQGRSVPRDQAELLPSGGSIFCSRPRRALPGLHQHPRSCTSASFPMPSGPRRPHLRYMPSARKGTFTIVPGEPREPAGGGRGRETFQGERRTMASRRLDPQRWCPCNPGSRRAHGCLVCLAVSSPGLPGGPDAALLHPPFASVACGPRASFPHSAPQIPGAPETEDLDPRPERRPQGTTPHCVARSRPLSPFAPSKAPGPRVRSPVRSP
ncbi:mCG144990, partial [Mus musculus]